jgi:hypothetical protein
MVTFCWDKKQKNVVINADETGKSYVLFYVHPRDVDPEKIRLIGFRF